MKSYLYKNGKIFFRDNLIEEKLPKLPKVDKYPTGNGIARGHGFVGRWSKYRAERLKRGLLAGL